MTCHHNHQAACINKVTIFQKLSPHQQLEISDIAYTKTYEKGDMIYGAGDSSGTLYVLHTGRIKLYKISENGNQQILRIVDPGDFLGELTLFSALPYNEFAQTLEESEMCIVEGHRLKELMKKYPDIAFSIMDELSRRLSSAQDHIESISQQTVIQRISEALLKYAKDNDRFDLPITKGDLASQLAMSQETLSRQLTQLEKQGILALHGHRGIHILNRQALKNL